MMSRVALTLVLALALGLPLGGCSFTFVRGPKASDGDKFPTCSPSPSSVVGDLALTVWSAVLLSAYVSEDSDSNDAGGVALLSGSIALFAASTIYGGIYGTRCSRAREQYEAKERLEMRAKLREQRRNETPGTAAAPGAESGVCFANQTCMVGLHCDSARGQCVPGATKAAGGTCTMASECDPGLECSAGVCAMAAVPECAQDLHCAPGTRCVGGRCEAIPGGEAAPTPAPL